MSFGFIDDDVVKGGMDGFVYFSNIGVDCWAVLMDDVHYGQRDLGMFFDSGGKMSIIDTGNTSIQIPYS